MIKITDQPITPETVIAKAKTDSSGCVVTYVGLIRDVSRGKPVRCVEYNDPQAKAAARLEEIVAAAQQMWPINNMAIIHRIGRLEVGDINLVVAVAAAHRTEGFAACQYAIDQFKEKLPTKKRETYQDGSIFSED